MTANDRPVVTRKGREHGDTAQSGGLACRTPENIVVNLPDIEDALLAGYRRA